MSPDFRNRDLPTPSDSQLLDLLDLWEYARSAGRECTPEELCAECPELADELRRAIACLERFDPVAAQMTRVEVSATSDDRLPAVSGYEILDLLGRGGMGVVYRARHRQLNRLVALKVLKVGNRADPAELARFRTEAEAVARLQHPNIVQIFEIGESNGLPYLALEFVPGGTLAQALAGQPRTPKEAAGVVEQLACAVHAAHQKGVIHRDLKPANVLLARTSEKALEWVPKVADFGLAKQFGLEDEPFEGKNAQTQSGQVLGTPSYMAPEQAAGRVSDVGPPADIYSLGVILYQMLTGKPPFRAANTIDTLFQVIHDEPLLVRQLQPKTPINLETIAHKCLHKDPSRRYASALALAEDLRRWQAGEPILARPIGVLEHAILWTRRRPTLSALLTVGVLVGFFLTIIAVWYNRRAGEIDTAARAETLVISLAGADTAHVPERVRELAAYHRWTDPLLNEIVATAPQESKERLHASLALLPRDPDQVHFLVARFQSATPDEVLVLRESLEGHRETLVSTSWNTLEDSRSDPSRRFRAACALAGYDPSSPRWTPDLREFVANHLARENPLLVGKWAEALRPIRPQLLNPLARIFRDIRRSESERFLAANLLADYADVAPELLADLALDADARQYAALWPRLQAHHARVIQIMRKELATTAAPDSSAQNRELLSSRQAQAAVVLLQLNQESMVWPLFRHSPDPQCRTFLIHRLAPMGVDPGVILERIVREPDTSARRALILSLGEFGVDWFSPEIRQSFSNVLLREYREDPDPGIHSAVDWLLRQRWGKGKELERIDQELAGHSVGGKRWWVDRQGHTMATIGGPLEFLMGAPQDEPAYYGSEIQHRRRITRTFALATREVTLGQYRNFLADHPEVPLRIPKQYAANAQGPILSVTWYEAAQYCRWLSKKEGIGEDQMCYPDFSSIKSGMRLEVGHLGRTGYRLPTEAEWEYASRAGATTSRAYGSSEQMLGRYAWVIQNSGPHSWPVGRLEPNDLGLFDIYGNAWEWCHGAPGEYPRGGNKIVVSDDFEGPVIVCDTDTHLARGGSFLYHETLVRSAKRYKARPSTFDYTLGFRVARTVPKAP